MNNAPCEECESCIAKLRVYSMASSLLLFLMKGIVGILGGSESLASDSLYSLYQAYVIYSQGKRSEKTLWALEMILSMVITLGLADILLFSGARLLAAANGTLMKPSPVTICVALISTLLNHLFYTYSVCGAKKTSHPLTRTFKLSIIVSGVVLVGLTLSRTFFVYGDGLASIVAAILVLKSSMEVIVRGGQRLLMLLHSTQKSKS